MKRRAEGGKARGSGAAVKPAEGARLIDMDEAVAMLKTTRPTFYRWLRSGRIKGMKAGRQWRFDRADVERFMRGEAPRVELPASIDPLLSELDCRLAKLGAPSKADEAGGAAGAVARTIKLAHLSRASDIHVTSHIPEGRGSPVGVLRLRIDGTLQVIAEFDARLLPALIEQWKAMAACDIHETRKPQDGRILMSVPGTDQGSGTPTPLDVRVCFVPAVLGESVTARILSRQQVNLDLAKLQFSDPDLARIRAALAQPWGLVLCTGPTGSGKTTVLYSCLQTVSRPEVKIVTVEDPVEFVLPWATQIPVRPQLGLTFPAALRSVLRSDPDVIMIGEIRDLESAQVVMQAVLTGHLVMTTLHTDTAAGALLRLRDIGVDAFLVADATKLVIAQRLVRRLCQHCRRDCAPEAGEMAQMEAMARAGGLDLAAQPRLFKAPVGCPKCSQTGYRGRRVIAETLPMTPEIGRALREGADVNALRDLAVRQGMTTLAADGLRLVTRGETTLRELGRLNLR